jgi:transposase
VRRALPGHYKTTTVTAALRTTGLCAFDLADGATNGQRFRDYVANRLVPVLRPGDIVILDNLQAHTIRVSGVCFNSRPARRFRTLIQ